MKEYEFCVKGKHGNSFYLKGFAVPVICAPICNQRIDMVKSQFKQLEELIPNDVVSDDGEIDILVGADYYWSLVTEDIIRLNMKLVAMRSKLGYILSGPVDCRENRTTYSHKSNCIHVMKVATDPLISIEIDKALDKKVEKILVTGFHRYHTERKFGI